MLLAKADEVIDHTSARSRGCWIANFNPPLG
jgi:hypothetical protein